MKNQLEQVNSANRTLQNYVHYLKASYANVFGDSALTSSLNTDHKWAISLKQLFFDLNDFIWWSFNKIATKSPMYMFI